jgi:signal transduction histidine kinase
VLTPPAGPAGATSADAGAAGPPGRWLREHARLVDAVVVAAVFGYNLLVIGPFPAPEDRPAFLVLLAVSVLLCAPYPFRRRYPFAVFGVMFLAACAQIPFGEGFTILIADVMLVFAVHHIATRFRTAGVPAAALVAVWLPLAAEPMLRVGNMSLDTVVLLELLIVWAWTWGTLVRVRRAHVAGLRERALQLERDRDAQARIAAARERARIAREIHDVIAHSLGVMVVVADGASMTVHTDPERARRAMIRVRDTGRTAMAETRRMLDVLRDDEPGEPELAPQPGTARLERLVEDSRAAGVPAALTVEGEPVPLAPGLDLAVYRVAQEALTNVRKHAGPELTRAEVALTYRDREVEVRVTDDGRGSAGAAAGGHGLVGMRERVAACGGTVHAGDRPGGGFEVVAVVPTGGGR